MDGRADASVAGGSPDRALHKLWNLRLRGGLFTAFGFLSSRSAWRTSAAPVCHRAHPTFYKRLKAGQSCFCSDTVRDFLDMSDFLSLMDLLLESPDFPTGAFNVSTGEGRSIKDVYDAVAKYLDIRPPEVPIVPPGADDVPAMILDPSETERKLGWRAGVSFEETIDRQLRWYDAHGVTDVFSHLAQPKKEGLR